VELTLQREVLSVGTHFTEEVTVWGMNSLYRRTNSSCGEGIHFREGITVCGRNILYGGTPASCGQEHILQSVCTRF